MRGVKPDSGAGELPSAFTDEEVPQAEQPEPEVPTEEGSEVNEIGYVNLVFIILGLIVLVILWEMEVIPDGFIRGVITGEALAE